MHQRALAGQVQQLKKDLEEVEAKLQGEALPLPLLEDLKDAVDHVRSTLWAAISSKGDPYAAGVTIVRLRLKRTAEMCRQIILDIDANEITVDSHELSVFRDALKASEDRVRRLYASGM